MLGYTSILAAIAPVFLLMALGAGLRASGRLTAEADASLMRLVVQVFYPALILRFILGSEALRHPANLFFAPGIGFGTIVLGFVVAFLLGRLLGLKKGAGHRTFAFTGGVYNYGYMAIPVVVAVFPENKESILALLLLHNVGVEVAIWSLGIILITGQFSREAWRKLLNPPVLTLAVALPLSLTGLDRAVPDFIHALIGMLAECAIPLGLVLAGATLTDLLRERTSLLAPLRVPLGACLHRALLMPLAFLGLAATLPGLSHELRMVMLVQAAMPAGIFPIVISRHYNGHLLTAIQVVFATSLLSLLTTPLWIKVGLRWLGE
jgi:hypothetical protein